MVNTKNPKIIICNKCGSENMVYNNDKFVLCKLCKSIKQIKDTKIED